MAIMKKNYSHLLIMLYGNNITFFKRACMALSSKSALMFTFFPYTVNFAIHPHSKS